MQTSAMLFDETSERPRTVEREYTAGGRIKGGTLRAHISWAREWSTAEQWVQLLDALPADVRGAVSSVILASSWYPFGWLVDLERAIAEVLGNGQRTILHQAGRHAATANLDTIYRALERENPHTFFRYSALLQSQFQDFGSATWETVGRGHGRMIQRHQRCFSPYHCASMIGYYEQCARMHDAVDVIVEEISCHCIDDQTCTFDIQWE